MFKSLSRSVALAIGLAVFVAACGSSDGDDAGDSASSVTPPDTTGAAIWAHIHEANYSTDWELWPGKGRLYTGTQPHVRCRPVCDNIFSIALSGAPT